MKYIGKTLLATAALATSIVAQAEISANAGFVSDYYYRGSNLGDGGGYVGVDYEESGFYAGVWAIDDQAAGNDGLEIDYYFGYGTDFSDSVSFSAGYTRYDYTYSSDFEEEINLNLGIGPISLEYSFGKDDDFGATTETDFDFTAISWSGEVFGLTYGDFDNKDTNDGVSYIEGSASGEVSGFDASVTIGNQIDVQTAGVPSSTGNGYIVFSIGKSFTL